MTDELKKALYNAKHTIWPYLKGDVAEEAYETIIAAAERCKLLEHRLKIAEETLKQCRCVSTSDEGTQHYPAQEALGRIRESTDTTPDKVRTVG